ncbi:MAG: phosphoenolpyruvate carboxykinase (ATP) [Vampirovibrionales bacterium]|nr:phosphoenolpyruvate carboxykinase (ATP) [Vampirovibrionales bacterium]
MSLSKLLASRQNDATLLSAVGLDIPVGDIHYQFSPAQLIEHALQRKEGSLASNGALVVTTGKYTGRSPNDRFIVDDSKKVHTDIDWGEVNHPTTPEVFDKVYAKVLAYLHNRAVYIFDGFAGADAKHRLPVRFINELASQNLFVHQLFIRPTQAELADFTPKFSVIAVPGLKLDPKTDGVNSEAAILVDLERRLVLVVASQYSGEMKKSIFAVMNYLMPAEDVFPMHCSVNMPKTEDKDVKSALFFGLSGTGKTTLSADPDRILIGDDEHGWGPDGVFNFEGGCYAKTIRLSKENEPEIWEAIRFGALVENAVLHPQTRELDYDDDRITENGRVGYPIEYIPNAKPDGLAPHPATVIFLTADAFGVLPPVAKLTPEQAQYHFISGYTSKLAGTERGITEPKAAFSTCFGAPFMPRPAAVYAELLTKRIQQHQVNVYLINTGWQGGPYGVGKRISIPLTRAIVNAALDGSLEKASYFTHPILNLQVPTSLPSHDDVKAQMLNPREGWADKAAYDRQATQLAEMFVKNFATFDGVEHLVSAGPRVATTV